MSKNTREQVTDAVRNCVDCGSMVIGSSDVEESVDDIMFIIEALEQENKRLREALEWYGEHAAGCRLIHSGGDPSRHNLQDDGGKRARAALEEGKQ